MLEESASAIQSSLWASMNSWFTPTVLFLFLNLMIGTIVFTSTQKHHQTNSQQNDNTTNQPRNNSNNIARSPPSSVLQRLKSINFYTHYRSQEPPQTSSLVRRKPIPDSDTLFNVDHTSYQQDHTQSLYFFQDPSQETLETPLSSQVHYVFEQTHDDNPQETQPGYVFEQTHEENHQESETHFVLEEKDSTFDDFQLALEEEESEQSMDEVHSQVMGSNFSRTTSDTEPAGGKIPAKLPAKMRKSASLKSPFGHFEEEVIVEARRPATVREKGNAKVTDGDEEVDAKADDFINRFKHQLKLQRLDSIIRYKDMIGRATVGK